MKSFVELSKKLLTEPDLKGKYILSDHFSQDPLENYFGQQRSSGGWCQNPTVSSCLISAQSLCIQGSMAMLPVRGNSSRKRRAKRCQHDRQYSFAKEKRKERYIEDNYDATHDLSSSFESFSQALCSLE